MKYLPFLILIFIVLGCSEIDKHGDKIELKKHIAFNVLDSKQDRDLVITGNISNHSNVVIYDVSVWCDVFAPSGTRIDTLMYTVYEKVSPKEDKKVTNINFGSFPAQGKTFNCFIQDFDFDK